MMNIVALFLVGTSLLAASVWPQGNHDNEQVIVKEGHRVITVEYDEDGPQHKTKVSISPDHHPNTVQEAGTETFNDAAASVMPNLGFGISSEEARAHGGGGVGHRPAELICDAFGKCKHKMASVIGRAKGKAQDATEKVTETVLDEGVGLAREAKDALVDSVERVVETMSQKGKDFKQYDKETLAARAREKAGDVVSSIGHGAKDAAKTAAQKAKDVSKESMDRAKEKAADLAEDVATAERVVKETASQKAEDVKEGAKRSAQKANASAGKVFDGMRKVFTMEAWETALNILRLMGFTAAYGMGLWVTFVSSYVLSRALTRQQFAVVQSKIYPVYFKAMGYSIGAALLGHILVHRNEVKADVFQTYSLLAALSTVLVNAKYLEPKATKVMMERLKMEKEENRGGGGGGGGGGGESPTSAAEGSPSQELVRSKIGALSEKLKKLNTYSSFLNVVCLMALSCHQVYLSHCLTTTTT